MERTSDTEQNSTSTEYIGVVPTLPSATCWDEQLRMRSNCRAIWWRTRETAYLMLANDHKGVGLTESCLIMNASCTWHLISCSTALHNTILVVK